MNIPPSLSGQRFHQLDAMRGIAALSVVICHYFEVFPTLYNLIDHQVDHHLLYLLCVPGVSLLWSGHTAVLFFFLLSGFVLSLPFLEPKTDDVWNARAYGIYMARRICRIYLPYLACILAAMMLACVLPTNDLRGLSPAMSQFASQVPSMRSVAEHVLLIGRLNPNEYNGVIWTLAYEMRISIVFPIIALSVARNSAAKSLSAALAMSVAGILLCRATNNRDLQVQLATVHFAAIFMAGAVLAKYRRVLLAKVENLGRPAFAGLAVLSVLMCSAEAVRNWVPAPILSHPLEAIVLAGAALGMLLALSSSWLLAAPLVWLGRTSYSLYLWHMPVLLAVLHLTYGYVPLWLTIPLTFAGSFGVGHLMHRWIEQPAAELSRNLGRRRRPVVIAEMPSAPAIIGLAA